MDNFKRCFRVGKGGMKCYCCSPKPGKDRDQVRRTARRLFKRSTEQIIKESDTPE